MKIKFTKRLLLFGFSIIVAFFSWGMTTATASNYLGSQVTIFALANKPISQTIAFPQTELTPQERQKLQGVRQRRNKEIMEVLDSSQRTQLEHELHFSHDIDRALAVIDLNPQQQEFISTVIELTNLKMRAIFSHHALLERNYSRSQEL